MQQPDTHTYYLHKVYITQSLLLSLTCLYQSVRAHVLPLTNIAINKSGTKLDFAHLLLLNEIYFADSLPEVMIEVARCANDQKNLSQIDRNFKVFSSETGTELMTLEGHKNVVYALAFNNPYGFVHFYLFFFFFLSFRRFPLKYWVLEIKSSRARLTKQRRSSFH